MGKKNSNKDEENGEQIISKIIKEKIYEINVQGHEMEDSDEITLDIAMWADQWSQDITHKLCRIIQTELGFISNFMGQKDVFSAISNLLFQRFHIDFMENKDLEKSIEYEIGNLENYNFLTPKDLFGEYDSIEDEYEEISFDQVKDLILSLRERRILIYKTLLDEFKKKREKYLNFMKKQDYTYY